MISAEALLRSARDQWKLTVFQNPMLKLVWKTCIILMIMIIINLNLTILPNRMCTNKNQSLRMGRVKLSKILG